MKAFCEKSDFILRILLPSSKLSWDEFTRLTQIDKTDALLFFLKDCKGLIDYTPGGIFLTETGRKFISTTSFVEQRDNQQHA